MTHTDHTGLVLAHDDMTDQDIVEFLRWNGERLYPAGEKARNCTLGRELMKLSEIVQKRLKEPA